MENRIETKLNSKEIRSYIQNDISSSIFIDAGAGAGKTSSIVGRVLNQIKAGISPKRIVIITFTNKATEEILSRINSAVYNASVKETDLKIKEILTNAFNNLSSMTISTIHSFCYTLLSERSLNIKLPIGVELMEDEDLENEQNKIFNRWIKSLNKSDYDKLANKGLIDYTLVESMKKYFKIFSKLEDSIYEIEKIDSSKISQIKDALLKFIEQYEGLASDFSVICGKNKEEVFNSKGSKLVLLKDDIDELDEKDLEDFLNGNMDSSKLEIIQNALDYAKEANLKSLSKKDDIKAAKLEFDNIISEAYPGIIDLRSYFMASKNIIKDRIPIEYGYKAYEFYKENRSRIKISKDELLYLTNEIIKDDKARCYFASKYDCIYVDEFQDTDHIQADFIWRLTEEIDNYHKKNNIDCGSLVVVGDPKQSIYRFRGADPEVFFKVKADYKYKKSVIYSLNYNFRSNNLILDYINNEFDNKDIQGESLSYSPMLYNDNHIVPQPLNDKCIAGVFYYNNDPLYTEEDNIASLIKKLVDEEYMIPKYVKNSEFEGYKYQKIAYNDFLVLFHQFDKSVRFVEAFKKYDIPVSISGRVDFKNEHGLKVFRRLFRGIVTPQDRIAKMGAIEALRMNDYDKNFNNEDEAFNFYNDLYDSILNDTHDLSGYGKALYLKEHLDYILGDRDSYQSIYIKLTQAIENAFAKSISNAISLADYFDKYFESEISEELIMDEHAPSIRFMNAHKSKGLEGNIVIWVDNGGTCDRKESYFKEGNLYHFGVDLNQELSKKAFMESQREYGRLEYVAATRAMNVLIFSNAIEDEKLFNRTGYDYHFNDLEKFQYGNLPSGIVTLEEKTMPLEYNSFELEINNCYKPNIIHMSPSKYEIHEKRDKTADFNPLRPFGNVLGTIMHRSLELLILRRKNNDLSNYSLDDLKALARQSIYESANDIDFTNDYIKYEKFIISVLKATKKYYSEISLLKDAVMVEPEFSYSLFENKVIDEFKTDADSLIYLNGTMDLFIKYKDKILIIDYKSDFIGYQNDEQFSYIIKNEYQNQLNVYRKSAEIMFKDINKIETKIIYFKNYNYDLEEIIPVEVEIKP